MDRAEPRDLSPDEVTARVVWASERLAALVSLSVDPVQLRRSVRASLEGRARLSAAELTAVLERALREAGLIPAAAADVRDALHTVELPLVDASAELLFSERRGNQLHLERADGTTQWLGFDEARALVAAGSTWLTAAPAAALAALGPSESDHATPWKRLRALAHLERDDLWVVVIYAAAVGLFTLATPIAVQSLVSTVAFGTLLQPIVVLSVLLLVALGFQQILRALQARVVETMQQRVFARSALDLAWRLPRVRHGEELSSETVNRFFEVVTVQKAGHVLLTDGIATVLQVAIGLLVLAFYHPALLAFAIVLVALVSAVVLVPARRGLETSLDESAAKYEVAAWLQQLAQPAGPFRSTSGAALALDRTDALTRRYLAARRDHFRVVFGQLVGTLALQVLAAAALLGLGGWLVISRELTLGQLVAAELIVASVTASVAKASKLLDATYDLLTSVEKLGHVLDLPLEAQAAGEQPPGQGPLRLEARGLPHHHADLELKAGERVCIIDAPGSALGAWLAGDALPSSGHVTHNGVDTRRARAPELREEIALVTSEGLFDGTILENVVVGRERVTAAEVRAALKRVGLLDELLALPEGIDTVLNAHHPVLDRSQVLRLLVARAIVANPRLLVLDVALEVLPARAHREVLDALTREQAPWTLVALVRDRSSATARACSRVVEAVTEEAA